MAHDRSTDHAPLHLPGESHRRSRGGGDSVTPRALVALGILGVAGIVLAAAFAYGAAFPYVVTLLRGETP